MKLFLLGVFIVPAFLSCVSFSVSEPAVVPEDFFGITPDDSILIKEEADLLDYFDAVWIRSTIRWTGVEPEEGKWNFEFWDNYVAKSEAAGKKLILILGFDNTWLYSDNKEHRAFTEREISYFLKYVEQVVSRYRTRIVYEIWNEPNWLFWKGTAKQFYPVSVAAAKKIREMEPNAVIIAGSTARVSKRFTRGMFNAGAMEYVDGFSLHPYATSPKGTISQIIKQRKVLDEFNFDKPIWVTEVGYSTGPISFCNIKRYPEYIVKTLSGLAVRSGDVRNLIWFKLMNDYNKGEEPSRLNPAPHFGLTYPDRVFKPGAEAFRLTASSLAGAEYRPELPIREGISSGITSLYFKRKDGRNILILWKDSEGKQKLRLTIPGVAEILRHNIHSGKAEILPMKGSAVLEISLEPVFISWTGGDTVRLSSSTLH